MTSPVYLHVTLTIRRDGYPKWCDAMARQVPIIESYGWKLLSAYITAIGRLYTVVDIWELPDANSYDAALSQIKARPDYPAFSDILAETVEEETVSLMRKLTFVPAAE